MTPFNIVAQLQLRAPTNVRQIVTNLRRQLAVTADIKINFSRNANRTLTSTTANVKSLTTALADLDKQASSTNASITRLVASVNALANSQRKITISVRQTGQALAGAAKPTQQLSDSVENFGKQSALAIRRFAAFLIPARAFLSVTTGLDKGFRAAIAFERELVKVAQVTGKTLGGLKDLSAEITRVSTTFGVASSELLKASTVLSQAGLTATEVRKSLQLLALTDLAPNFESMTDTVEGFIAIRQQFGTSVDDMTSALSSLNAVAGAYAVESGDIIAAIRKTGGAFKAAGGDLNELVALFTSVRQTTRESADSIATGFRTIFTRMQRIGTSRLLKQVGVDLRDLSGNFVGPYKAVQKLSEALSRVDPRSQLFSQVVEELGGFRQVSKVIPLIQQFGVAQEALNVALRNTNSLEEESGKAIDTLANRLVRLEEKFFALIRTISDNAVFKALTGGVLGLAESFIKLAESLEPILPLITAFAGVKLARGLPGFTAGFFGGIRRAGGGTVPGQGNTDSVPAMLTPGEFVIRKSAAQAIGANKLNAMNKYATGGKVAGKNNTKVSLGSIPEFGAFFFQEANKEAAGNAVSGAPYSLSFNKMKVGRENLINLLGISSAEAEGISVVGQPRSFFLPPGLKSKFSKTTDSALTSLFGSIVESALGIRTTELNLGTGGGFNKEEFTEKVKSQIPIESITGSIYEGFVSGLSHQVRDRDDSVGNFDFKPSMDARAFNAIFGAGAGSLKYAEAKLSSNRDSMNSVVGKAVALAKGPLNALSQDHFSLFTGRSASSQLEAQDQRKSAYAIKRAGGGSVPGLGVGDTVPAMLTPGEFVINKSSAQRIGYSTLNNLNNGGVQKFAFGGTVGAGTLVGGATSTLGSAAGQAVFQGIVSATQAQLQLINKNLTAQQAYNAALKLVTNAQKQNANVITGMNAAGQVTIQGLQSLAAQVTKAKVAMARQQGAFGSTGPQPLKVLSPSRTGTGVFGSVIGLSSLSSLFGQIEGEAGQMLSTFNQAALTFGGLALVGQDLNSGFVNLAQKLKLVSGQEGVDKLFKTLSVVSAAGSIVASVLLAYSSHLNNQASKLEKGLTDPNNFNDYVSLRTQANFAQGTGVGAVGGALAGAKLGTLIAPGVGTAIGGAVGLLGGAYLGGSLANKYNDAQSKAEVGRQAQGVEQLANILGDINSGKAFGPGNVGKIRQAIGNATLLPSDPVAAKEAKSMLARQDVIISATIKKFTELGGSIDDFEKGIGKDLIKVLAQSTNSTYEATRKGVALEIEAREKSRKAIEAFNVAIGNVKNDLLSLSSIQKSYEASLEGAERGLNSLGSPGASFAGYGNLDINNIVDVNKYRGVATNVLGGVGGVGVGLGNRAADFATITRDLPGLIAQLTAVEADETSIAEAFRQSLEANFPAVSKSVTNEMTAFLTEMIEDVENGALDFQKRARANSVELADELSRKIGSTYGEAIAKSAEAISQYTKSYASKLEESNKMLDEVLGLQQQGLATRMQGGRIAGNLFNAPPSFFTNLTRSGADAEQALLGNPFGNTSRGIAEMKNRILGGNESIRNLQSEIDNPATNPQKRLALIDTQNKFKNSVDKATQSLKKMSDSSNDVIQSLEHELSQASSVRNSRKSLLDDFIFGTGSDRRKMSLDANLSVGALARGDLSGVPDFMRPNVGSFLGRLDPNTQVFGQRVGDLLDRIRVNEGTAMGLPPGLAKGIVFPGEQEMRILSQIQEEINKSVEASNALGDTILAANKALVDGLAKNQAIFFTDLKSIFVDSEVRRGQSRVNEITGKITGAESSKATLQANLNKLFGGRNLDYNTAAQLSAVLNQQDVQRSLRTFTAKGVGAERKNAASENLVNAFGTPEQAHAVVALYKEMGDEIFQINRSIADTFNTFGTDFSFIEQLRQELARAKAELEAVRAQAPQHKAGGGMARGTDTVPAMLTKGEYVVNAAATRRNKHALDAMNYGGVVYAAGGGFLDALFGGASLVKNDIVGGHNRVSNKVDEEIAKIDNAITPNRKARTLQSTLELMRKDAERKASRPPQPARPVSTPIVVPTTSSSTTVPATKTRDPRKDFVPSVIPPPRVKVAAPAPAPVDAPAFSGSGPTAAQLRAFRRGRSNAYNRKVRLGRIDPSEMGYDEYVHGPSYPSSQAGRENLVDANIALNRQARRNRTGVDYNYVGGNRGSALRLPRWNGQGGGMFNVSDPVGSGRRSEVQTSNQTQGEKNYQVAVESIESYNNLAKVMGQLATVIGPAGENMGKLAEAMTEHPIPSKIEHEHAPMEHHVAVTGLDPKLPEFQKAVQQMVINEVNKQLGKDRPGSSSPMERMMGG